MKQNVAPIIERIRALARLAAKNDSDLDERHGIDPDLGIRVGDPKTRSRIYATSAAVDVLERYLNGFGLETLRRVEAVMYSGRDDKSAVESREQLAETHSSKEDVVRTIMEKRVSFDPYFERGLERAKTDEIDLDTF